LPASRARWRRGLTAQQTDEQFNATLANSIDAIFKASITKKAALRQTRGAKCRRVDSRPSVGANPPAVLLSVALMKRRGCPGSGRCAFRVSGFNFLISVPMTMSARTKARASAAGPPHRMPSMPAIRGRIMTAGIRNTIWRDSDSIIA
jgi:hypothetical protein